MGCSTFYPYTESGSLDLRLRESRTVSTTFQLGSQLTSLSGVDFEPLVINPNPEVDFSKMEVPYHLTEELMSYIPKAQGQGSLMLDLGCGGGIHREVCEFAGFEYVGLDYDSPKAPYLGDAHSLPFKDESFEFILSIAVLEHIRYPFLMAKEAFRVLKPGGKFIGTVAFLEPYHLQSYYHHSHLGSLNTLNYGGFTVEHISPSVYWSVLRAQAVMGLFPRMPRKLAFLLVSPLVWLHRVWWRARVFKSRGTRVQMNELFRNTTGAFTFIAAKSSTPGVGEPV